MGVGSGHSRPRIAPSELDVDRSMRRRGRVVVEQRDARSGSWTVLATFGSEAEAAERIDEEVGLGRGAPADYLLRPLGLATWKRWVAVGVLVALAATCGFLLVVFWFER
jgi:hypothetical protein